MAAVSPIIRLFLLRHTQDFKLRKFLIHCLTKSVKPGLILSDDLIKELKTKTEPYHVILSDSLTSPVLPELNNIYTETEIKQRNKLDQWMWEHNLPQITESSDLYKLLLNYQNFTTLSDEQQAEADEYSREVRSCSNVEYYQQTIDRYFNQQSLFEIVDLYSESGIGYIAEVVATPDQIREGEISVCILSDDTTNRLMTETDTVELDSGDMANVKERMTTTVGRMIVNQLCYCDPFGDMFPYENKPLLLNKGDILNKINQSLLEKKISVESYRTCLDNVFYLGHFTELCTPCLDERSLTTDPNIKKRKAELLKQYEGQLDNPIVISKIEDELIAMDKEYMKGDNALRFYTPLGGATFDLWRKKLYISVGGIEAFSKDASKYEFLRNSLEEGVRVEDLAIYGNESRKGSYQRGHETQKGGYLTKNVIRAFHDSAITREDCGTRRGVFIDFGRFDISKFIGRYILLHGKWIEVTKENMASIPPQKYLMRSPLYCQCKNGYCYHCVGRLFGELDVRQLSLSIVDITTTFMLAAMKNMHGSKLALYQLTSLDDFVL